MAKKKKKAAKAPAPQEPPAAPEEPVQQAEPRKDSHSLMKILVVGAIFVAALVLAYYFFVMSGHSFKPGTSVDEETFKGIFLEADKVYIMMDVRGLNDPVLTNNVMQCGVDFAASSGFADKSPIPVSIGDDGCVTPDGYTPADECFSMLEDGITIYVRGGEMPPEYYSNGMVVYVGSDYVLSTCRIHRA